MPTLLILGAGPNQLPAFHVARTLGCRIVAIDQSDHANGYALADRFHVCDLTDVSACISIARTHAVDGVLTLAADIPVPAVAAICEALGLSGLSVSSATRATNKATMRRVLREAGIPVPASYAVTTAGAARAAARRISAPVIVKPADSSGGRGVTLVKPTESGDEVVRAFHRAVHFSRCRTALIEDFVDGPEVSVEAVTVQGRTRIVAVTDKLTTGPPFFVEIGHSQPCQSLVVIVERLCAVAIEAIAALGIDNSPSHTEIRIGSDGPSVIEVGGRLGGGFIASHLVPLSTGVDLVRAAVQLALGNGPHIESTHQKGAAIRFFTPPPGRIQCIRGLEEARSVDGVRLAEMHKRPGDRIDPLLDAAARVGYVIAEGWDAATAVRQAEAARDLVSFEMER